MKLSEKALKKIQDEMEHGEYQIPCGYENVEGMSIYHLEEHEFKPDDFKDVVVLLTVEESKQIFQSLDEVLYWSDCESPLTDKAMDGLNLLKQRIEQVEGKL